MDWPVTLVSWIDAQIFCAEYGFRLPTSAEWQRAYAASDGDAYWWGDSPEGGEEKGSVCDLGALGLFRSAPRFLFRDGHRFVASVGSFEPNSLGLFDMAGNVWEWCLDETGPGLDDGFMDEGAYRVIRGGSWASQPEHCGVSSLAASHAEQGSRVVGFRVVRDPSQP